MPLEVPRALSGHAGPHSSHGTAGVNPPACQRLSHRLRLRKASVRRRHGAAPATPLEDDAGTSYNPATARENTLHGARMALERTFSIIKPDATARNQTGRHQRRHREGGAEPSSARSGCAGPRPRPRSSTRCTRRGRSTATSSLHDLGPDRGAGAGRRRRGQEVPRRDGRHRPGQGRGRHHPQAVRRKHRAQLRARLGQHGQRQDRDRANFRPKRS
jgi:hypothetical protein